MVKALAKVEAAPQVELLQQRRRAALKMLKAKEARDSLITFTKFTMPDPIDPDNVERSRYDAQYFHLALADALERAEKGEYRRLIVTFPPRHGKSELASRRLPAWVVGRDPYRHTIFATYNQPFAEEFGKKTREVMNSAEYRLVFPSVRLAKGSQASDRLQTEQGGVLAFVGRGGSSTGRGADFLFIDDPLKDRKEADSPVIREECWKWLNDTLMSRLMTDTGVIVLIMTRWHEDDLVGRLTDERNPHFNAEEAAQWKIINIPAIAGENDALGRAPGEALWPERFGIDYLMGFKRRNPRGFSALYQQQPTPEDGIFFTADMIQLYQRETRPQSLRVYAASDHAVGTNQEHDRTCLLIVGIDDAGRIYILDTYWRRARSDVAVEAMIDMMAKWKPLIWWAESGHISKSIGPFLYRRMQERKVFCYVSEQTATNDKQVRAQSIRARMAMKMVFFPEGTAWVQDAKNELLKFPAGRFDDFVDALAHIGMGLERIIAAAAPTTEDKGPKTGTMAWVKADAAYQNRKRMVFQNLGGM